jgi:hypothetical protein
VKAANGELRIATKAGALTFEVGTAAENWREKILHPKTRAEKLAVKPGTRLCLLGKFETKFVRELQSAHAEIFRAANVASLDQTFFAAERKSALVAIGKFARKMKGAEVLWIVYPKRRKVITEMDVIAAGRKSGLKDVKVVGFSPTHTALKFVIPLEKR